MMQCPQCSTENRLGAIFCRSCGAKLQLDDVTSETFEKVTGIVPKDKQTRKKRIRSIIFNSLRLVFLALVVFGFYLALQLPDVERPETTSKSAKEFKDVRAELLAGIDRKNAIVSRTISEQAINSYLSERMAATESKEKVLRMLDSWVVIQAQGGDEAEVAWVFDVKLFGRLLRMQYLGTVKMQDGKIAFVPKGFFSARMGKLPLPTPFVKRWTKQLWASLVENEQEGNSNQKLLDGISKLEFNGGDVQVTVGQ
jgi:hypothetical protein